MRPPESSDLPPFQTVVDDHYEGLFRFALSLARKTDDAKDLVQQTFLIYAEKGSQIQDTSKIKSWLFTTLYREFLGMKRKQERSPSVDTDDFSESLSEPDKTEKSLEAKLVIEAIHRLDPIYRDPLLLFYLEDHPYREIAEILEIPTGTVMSRLSRGKAELRRQLDSA